MKTYKIWVIYPNQETEEVEGLFAMEAASWISYRLTIPHNSILKLEVEIDGEVKDEICNQ